MNRRRISIALIAATSTLLASVTPAVAQSADLSGSDGTTSSAETTTVEAENEDDVNTDPEPGSQFMGPRELASSIASGNGSSGTPDDQSGDDDDDSNDGDDNGSDEINLDDYPEWMHSSLAPSRDVEMFFVVLNAILTVGGALAQAAVILAPIIGTDRIREILISFGINPDA